MSKYGLLILVIALLCLCTSSVVYSANVKTPQPEGPPDLLPLAGGAANHGPELDPRLGHFVRWAKKDGGNNHWYAIIQDEMYWEDAAALAESSKFRGKYGYLATITSAEENEFILDHVIADTHQPSIMDMFWLGGQDVGGDWTWTTGEPFSYVNWAPTEPNNVGIETVLGMWGPNTTDPRRPSGTWNNSLPNDDVNSLAKVWGVVEWGRLDEGDGGGTTSITNLIQWPASEGGNDHWYAVIPQELYWVQANAVATTLTQDGMPGYLATVTSSEEDAFILNNVIAGTNQPSILDLFWLGGREDFTGAWRWITGETFGYTNWASGEPNNPGIETALAMVGPNDTDIRRAPGEWLDVLPDNTVNSLHRWWAVIEWGASPLASRSLAEETGVVPGQFGLEQNFPNPFNPATEIRYSLAAAGHVRIDVINMLGQVVNTLVDDEQSAGSHSITWHGTNRANQQVASGVYFYRMQTAEFVSTKRMTLLR